MKFYDFFAKHFHLSPISGELHRTEEIRIFEDLTVGLPENNQTILGLTRMLTGEIRRTPGAAELRHEKLQSVVRYRPFTVCQAGLVANTKNKGVEARSFRLALSNGLSATAIWLEAIETPDARRLRSCYTMRARRNSKSRHPTTSIMASKFLALDLLVMGDACPRKPSPADYALLLASVREGPVGIEAAQLIGASNWARKTFGAQHIRPETYGMRRQTIGLIAIALEPRLFSKIDVRQGIRSLGYLLDAALKYRAAPDPFCLDLYEDFDLDVLAELAAPARVKQAHPGLTR